MLRTPGGDEIEDEQKDNHGGDVCELYDVVEMCQSG